MDREILFRGQTRKRGEKVRMDGTPVDGNWVYGGIFPGEGDFSVIYSAHPVEKHVVHADTVGQYTGLIDRNGVKIFEGDIYRSRYGVRLFEIRYLTEYARFAGVRPGTVFSGEMLSGVEVIGNIHDNPEMMERKGKTHERS